MPRRSYEAHRASRLHVGGRSPSAVESETDLESLASYSTYNSVPFDPLGTPSSSRSGISYRAGSFSSATGASTGMANGLGSSGYPAPIPLRHRTFSNTSSITSHSPLPPVIEAHFSPDQGTTSNKHVKSGAPTRSPLDDTTSSGTLYPPRMSFRGRTPTMENHERRRKRREERAKRSTLKGEMYDSPLRRVIRWLSSKGLSGWGLVLGLLVVAVFRTGLGMVATQIGSGEAATLAPVQGSETLRIPFPQATTPFIVKLFPTSLVSRHARREAESVVWVSGVIRWITTEGKRGGRSWRTQLTGIMTMLLSPAFLSLPLLYPPTTGYRIGLLLWALHLTMAGYDALGALLCCIMCKVDPAALAYLPALTTHFIGKRLWLGRLRRDLTVVAPTVSLLCVAVWLGSVRSDERGGAFNEFAQFVASQFRPSFDREPKMYGILRGVLDRYVSQKGQTRLSVITATTFASLPPLVILLYSARSIRSSTPRAANVMFPVSKLLLPALFTSAIPSYLFSHHGDTYLSLIPLIPLGLMMALRGGKEVGQSETEAWELGVLLNITSAVHSACDSHAAVRLITSFKCLAWVYVIGYTPSAVQTPWIRRLSYVVYTSLTACIVSRCLVDAVSTSHEVRILTVVSGLRSALMFVVFGAGYLWGNQKLIESSWALSGLGLGGEKKAH